MVETTDAIKKKRVIEMKCCSPVLQLLLLLLQVVVCSKGIVDALMNMVAIQSEDNR